MHYEPATSIIARLGGITKVAAVTGVSVHTVLKWRLAKDKGGTQGHIPRWHHDALLDDAGKREIPLVLEDFVRTAEAA